MSHPKMTNLNLIAFQGRKNRRAPSIHGAMSDPGHRSYSVHSTPKYIPSGWEQHIQQLIVREDMWTMGNSFCNSGSRKIHSRTTRRNMRIAGQRRGSPKNDVHFKFMLVPSYLPHCLVEQTLRLGQFHRGIELQH